MPKISAFLADDEYFAGKQGSLFTGTDDPIRLLDALEQPKKSIVQAKEVIMLLRKPQEQRTKRNLEKMDLYFELIPFFKSLMT